MNTPDILEQIAADIRAGVEEPEKEWEVKVFGRNGWSCVEFMDSVLHYVIYYPERVRRKPKRVTRTITYPEPIREEPEDGQEVYIADTFGEEYCRPFYYRSDDVWFRRWFECGLLHDNKDDAVEHGKQLAEE